MKRSGLAADGSHRGTGRVTPNVDFTPRPPGGAVSHAGERPLSPPRPAERIVESRTGCRPDLARGNGSSDPERVAAPTLPGETGRRIPNGLPPRPRPGINARAPEAKPTEGAEGVSVRRLGQTHPPVMLSRSEASLAGFPQHHVRGTGRRFLTTARNDRQGDSEWRGTPVPTQPLQWASPQEPGHLSPGGVDCATGQRVAMVFPRAGSGRQPARGSTIRLSGRASDGNPFGVPQSVSPVVRGSGVSVIGATRRSPGRATATPRFGGHAIR